LRASSQNFSTTGASFVFETIIPICEGGNRSLIVQATTLASRTLAADAQDRDVVSKAMNADAVLFFSPSAVEGFDSVCGDGRLAEFSEKGIILASGPVTLAALQAKGIVNAGAAKEPSVARIIEALANLITARQRQCSSRAGTQ